MLVIAHRYPPGAGKLARRRQRLRAGRRGQSGDRPRALRGPDRHENAVAGQALQGLRCRCRRFRRRRGRGRAAAQAPGPGRGGRRSDLRGDQGQHDQRRRQDQRLYRAQPAGPEPAGGRLPGPGRCRCQGGELCRGPRYRHCAGRSDRDRRPDPGVQRRRRDAGQAVLRDRLDQIQSRPLRKRGRHRRRHQGAAATQAPPVGAVAARRRTQSRDRLCQQSLRGPAVVGRVASSQSGTRRARPGMQAHCHGVVLRRRRGQRPRGDRRIRRRPAAARDGRERAAAGDHSAVGQDASPTAAAGPPVAGRAGAGGAGRCRSAGAGLYAAGRSRGDGASAGPAGNLDGRAENPAARLDRRPVPRRARWRAAPSARPGAGAACRCRRAKRHGRLDRPGRARKTDRGVGQRPDAGLAPDVPGGRAGADQSAGLPLCARTLLAQPGRTGAGGGRDAAAPPAPASQRLGSARLALPQPFQRPRALSGRTPDRWPRRPAGRGDDRHDPGGADRRIGRRTAGRQGPGDSRSVLEPAVQRRRRQQRRTVPRTGCATGWRMPGRDLLL